MFWYPVCYGGIGLSGLAIMFILKAAKVATGEETNRFRPAAREEPPTKLYTVKTKARFG